MKTRILIVDDNTEFVEELRRGFDSEQYDVTVAYNGKDGLEKSSEVDCILLDLVMPVMDGFAFLEKFDKKSAKVIAVSALSQDVFIAKAMELGCDYYLLKPTPVESIVKKVEEALNQKSR